MIDKKFIVGLIATVAAAVVAYIVGYTIREAID